MKSKKTGFCTLVFLMALMLLTFSAPAVARWGDGTGPEGLGPITGRGAGYCTGNSVPGYQNSTIPRLGLGRANSQGRGGRYRNIFNATGLTGVQRKATSIPAANTPQTITQEQRLEELKKQAEIIKNQLELITRQISEMESKK